MCIIRIKFINSSNGVNSGNIDECEVQANTVGVGQIWTGLNRLNGDWEWVSGQLYVPFNTNWRQNQPQNGQQDGDCARMKTNNVNNKKLINQNKKCHEMFPFCCDPVNFTSIVATSAPGLSISHIAPTTNTISIKRQTDCDPVIYSVEVAVNILHSFVGDLSVSLEHDVIDNLLIHRPGEPETFFGCSGNDIDVVFSDFSSNPPIESQPCTDVVPVFKGEYKPEEPLAVDTRWNLNITDHFVGDQGTLESWTLTINSICNECSASYPCVGGLVCQSGRCKRDCAALEIDGFLSDCSGIIPDIKGDIADIKDDIDTINQGLVTLSSATSGNGNNISSNAGLIAICQSQINGNDGNVTANAGLISSLQNQVNDNAANISANAQLITSVQNQVTSNDGNIARNAAEISKLQNALSKLENDTQDHLDRYTAHRGSSVGNVLNDGKSDKILYNISMENKDGLIIFLLILNTLTIIGGCISCIVVNKSRNKYEKYDNVRDYSTVEENEKLHH